MNKDISKLVDNFIHKINNLIFFEKNKKVSISEITKAYTKIYTFLVKDSENNGLYLYNSYQTSLKSYYQQKIYPVINFNEENGIEKIILLYNKHLQTNKYISLLLLRYLDRHYIRNNNLESISEIGETIFYNEIMLKNIEFINNLLLQKLFSVRKNEHLFIINKDLIQFKKIINIYRNKDKYCFVNDIIKSTPDYYSQNLPKQPEQYIKYCLDVIHNENLIFENIIDIDFLNLINDCLTKRLILDKIEDIDIKKYIINIFETINFNNFQQINNIILLFSKKDLSFDFLNNIVTKSIQNSFSIFLNSNHSLNSELISNISNLYSKYLEVLKNIKIDIIANKFKDVTEKAFQKNINYIYLNESKHSFVNILVRYFDTYLKKKNKLDCEDKIIQTFKIFHFISEKDYFLKLYSKYLSKRLLKSNFDIEKEIMLIKYLKINTNNAPIYKIENMINDIKKNEIISIPSIEIENRTKILTSNYWPKYENICLIKSRQITDFINNFNNDYQKKNVNKKLSWNNSLSLITIKLKNFDKPYLFKMSFIEATIISLFKDKHVLKIEEIVFELQIEKKKLMLFIKNLVKCKLFILENINENQVLKINDKFKSKKIMHTLPIVNFFKKDEVKKIQNETILSRKEKIKLVIVRLLKTKKTLDENNIIIQTINKISLFKPEILDIKECLQKLVENEYIKNDENNERVYHYIV